MRSTARLVARTLRLGLAIRSCGDERCRVEQVLQVIEDQEQVLCAESRDQRLGEWEATGLAHSETLGDRRGDERRFRDGGERDEDRSIGEF